jgi:hypothetical protein
MKPVREDRLGQIWLCDSLLATSAKRIPELGGPRAAGINSLVSKERDSSEMAKRWLWISITTAMEVGDS